MLIYLFIFIFGICIGSFLNVLIYRFPRSLKITGRSYCPKCRKKIPWYDNIPLLSFLLLGGRCRFCHSPISWQYPAVELATGFLTVFIFYYSFFVKESSLLVTSYQLLITYSLIVIFVSDLHYLIIPDQIVIPGIALLAMIRGWEAIFSGMGAAGFFALLVWLTKGKGMGWGDVKLVGFIGLILGFPKILIALWLAFLTGAVAGVILVLLKRKTLKSQIPFGPFLCAAALVSALWGDFIQKIVFPG